MTPRKIKTDIAYFDTSVLIKRYVREGGAARAREFLRRYQTVSCIIAPLEIFSALTRRRMAGDLGDDSLRAIVSRTRSDQAYWRLLELSAGVLSRAEAVISTTGARTLDALHIASALIIKEASEHRLKFITADQRQGEAADSMGLDVTTIAGAEEF